MKFTEMMRMKIQNRNAAISIFVTLCVAVLVCAWGDNTATLMYNPTSKTCDSDINFAGTTQIGGVTITAAKVTELAASASANTVSTIVKRDSSGNFAAGTITAALTGAASANPTILSGTAAPSTTPAKIGNIYIDTSAHKLYFADATVDSGGWVAAN